jgi:uncharacterized protein (TIGR02265 family)
MGEPSLAPNSAPSATRSRALPTKIVFAGTFEGFFRSLRDRLTPELKAKLRAEGLDLDKKLAPGYPFEVWVRVVDVVAEGLYSGLSQAEAHWKLGEDFLRGFAETVIGRAMFGVLRLLGPMKAFARMERNWRSGSNYVETKFTALNPTCAEVWMTGVDGRPWFNAGIILEGGRQIGVKNLRVEIVRCVADEATYRVTWDA